MHPALIGQMRRAGEGNERLGLHNSILEGQNRFGQTPNEPGDDGITIFGNGP